jgi:hypothetical protein
VSRGAAALVNELGVAVVDVVAVAVIVDVVVDLASC